MPEASSPAEFDSAEMAVKFFETLRAVADANNCKMIVDLDSIHEAFRLAFTSLSEDSRSRRYRLEAVPVEKEVPGAESAAYTKQLAHWAYHLFKVHPIIAVETAPDPDACIALPNGKLLHEPPASATFEQNVKLIWRAMFMYLSWGIENSLIRIFRDKSHQKQCHGHCHNFDCLVSYWDTFYGTSNKSPTNLDQFVRFVTRDAVTINSIAIILDHILYGACINNTRPAMPKCGEA